MASFTWHVANGADAPRDINSRFTIDAYPKTDLWRRTEEDDVFNAPCLYTEMQPSAFKRMSVTVSGPWKTQYDQGGPFLAFPRQDGPMRWIKAGIEYFEDKSVLGVVGTDRFSDWSLCPMVEGEAAATFEFVKDGATLWVYVVRNESRQPLREIKWAFIDFQDQLEHYENMHVGVYAAKPIPDDADARGAIHVTFQDFRLDASS